MTNAFLPALKLQWQHHFSNRWLSLAGKRSEDVSQVRRLLLVSQIVEGLTSSFIVRSYNRPRGDWLITCDPLAICCRSSGWFVWVVSLPIPSLHISVRRSPHVFTCTYGYLKRWVSSRDNKPTEPHSLSACVSLSALLVAVPSRLRHALQENENRAGYDKPATKKTRWLIFREPFDVSMMTYRHWQTSE